MNIDEIAKDIMLECEKDGEPVTMEEALEMAKMEINSKENCKRYEKNVSKKRKKSTKERKVDTEKLKILELVAGLLEENGIIPEIVREIGVDFELNNTNYTLKLIKHTKKQT